VSATSAGDHVIEPPGSNDPQSVITRTAPADSSFNSKRIVWEPEPYGGLYCLRLCRADVAGNTATGTATRVLCRPIMASHPAPMRDLPSVYPARRSVFGSQPRSASPGILTTSSGLALTSRASRSFAGHEPQLLVHTSQTRGESSNRKVCLPGLHFELRLTAFAFQIISCLLCSTIFGKMSRAIWALDRMLHGPGASASVILPRSQNQNGRDLFWNVEGVNRSSNLIVGSQPVWF
jgi:hypothetical protein